MDSSKGTGEKYHIQLYHMNGLNWRLVPDVINHPVVRSILNQRLDTQIRITGELGFEGVVNIAYRLRGQEKIDGK